MIDAGDEEATVVKFVNQLIREALDQLRDYLYRNVYETGVVGAQTDRVARVVERLFAAYALDEPRVLDVARRGCSPATDVEGRAIDFLASLGGREALTLDARLHGLRAAA